MVLQHGRLLRLDLDLISRSVFMVGGRRVTVISSQHDDDDDDG